MKTKHSDISCCYCVVRAVPLFSAFIATSVDSAFCTLCGHRPMCSLVCAVNNHTEIPFKIFHSFSKVCAYELPFLLKRL